MTELRQAAQAVVERWDTPAWEWRDQGPTADLMADLRTALAQPEQEPKKLWLWKNFVDGKPEYWAFDNAFPVHLECDDPQTLGEPCGYAIFKPSREGRTDISDGEVLLRIKKVAAQRPWVGLTDEEILRADPWEILRADPWMGPSDSNINPYQILLKVRTLEAMLKERNYG
jgi:hypothetical protein